MTRSNSSQLETFDPEVKRTFRRLWNLVQARISPKKERQEMEKTLAPRAAIGVGVGIGAKAGAAWAKNPRRTLMEYAQPSIDETESCIKKPVVQANNFELKPFYV